MKPIRTVLSRTKLFLPCAALMLGTAFWPLSGAAQIRLDMSTAEPMGRLEAAGRIDEPRGAVTLMILPDALTPEQLSAELLNRDQYVVRTIRADAAGGYSAELVMPEEMPSGAYTLYVSDGSTRAEADFSHVNPGQAQQALERINAAGRDEMVEALKAGEVDLALNAELLARYGTVMAGLLYIGRPERGYTMEELLREMDRSAAIGMIRDGRAEAAAERYGTAFGLVYQEDFAPLSSRIKTVFAEETAEAGLDRPAETLFFESLIFAQVTASASYMDALDALMRYRDYLNWDFSAYEELSTYEKSQVFSKLVSAGLSSFSDLRPAFDRLVKAAGAGQGEAGGTGVRPSGGGSSGGGGYSDRFEAEQESAGPQQTGKPASVFFDLEGHWSQSLVERLVQRGIVSGYEDGAFHPDQPVTRAEFAKLAGTALQLEPGGGQAFTDISPEDWYYPYVCGAQTAGLILGYAGRFEPMDQITREDSAVILYRALDQRGKAPRGEFAFEDSSLISEYAQAAVGALAAQGLLQGYAGSFQPKGSTTRAEAASMIGNMLRFLGEV